MASFIKDLQKLNAKYETEITEVEARHSDALVKLYLSHGMKAEAAEEKRKQARDR